jgi:hypothetical protein
MSADDTLIPLAWFSTATPDGPAFGDPATTSWSEFCGVLWFRRHGDKNGPGFVPARFKLEDDGRHVRRLKPNVIARTLVALDIEASKPGELAPSPEELAERVRSHNWAGAIWTSHNHRPNNPRCRAVLPQSAELDPDLPVVEVIAEELGVAGVLDHSKRGTNSYFYLPSCSGDDDCPYRKSHPGWHRCRDRVPSRRDDRYLEAARRLARRIIHIACGPRS